MENLMQVAPRELNFDDPSKAPLSSFKIVSIKPTTGTSVGSSTNSASSTDSIQFKLPSAGILKTGSMYLKYDIAIQTTAGSSGGVACAGGVLGDEHSSDSAPFSRMKVFSSDGTSVSDTPNYSAVCSINNRLTQDKSEQSSRGSILHGHGLADGEALDDSVFKVNSSQYENAAVAGDAVIGANALGVKRSGGGARNYRILSGMKGQNGAGGDNKTTTVCHQIQTGLLDHKVGHYLPTFAMGSGYQLEMQMADVKDAVKLVAANATGVQGGLDVVHTDATAIYYLKNISLVCELVFMDAPALSSINNLLCQGIKFRVPRVKTQVNSITSQTSTIQIAEHGRSINSAIFGLRNTTQKSKLQNFSNDYQYKVDGTNFPKNFQCQVGSEVVPSIPVEINANSYLELERCLANGVNGYRLGNSINAESYFKTAKQSGAGANEQVSGDCLFGCSFQSFSDKPALMSGKSSSAGSIPLSVSLEMNADPANTELFSMVESSSIVEVLHDGSCIVSR